MSNKVISTHTLSTTWRTSTTAYFLYQNGDSTYYKAELSGYVSSVDARITGKADVAQSTWINVTYSSNWVNISTTFPPTSYRKDTLGFIHLRVGAKDGASNPICTLPAGYVPGYQLNWVCFANPTSTISTNIRLTATGALEQNFCGSTMITVGEVIFST